MARAPSFVGLILAAGASLRMGSDKALLAWRGRTFLENHIIALNQHTDFVLVVAGSNYEKLEPLADAAGAFLIENPHPEAGQFSSMQVGLQEVLNRGRDAAIVALVDRPPAAPATLTLLRRSLIQAEPGIWAVVPEHAGLHGHPIVVAREMIGAFLAAPTTSNAREVMHANQKHIRYLPVDDAFTIENINSVEDYERIRSQAEASQKKSNSAQNRT